VKHPGNQYVGDCPTCGKHRFATRRAAKRAARFLHPHDSMRAYRCGPEYWHYSHNSPWIVRGEAS
jgi:hypothetical protein